MSLLKTMMSPFVLMVEVPVDDPGGGYMSQWVAGASFNAFIRKEDTPEITVGTKTEVKERLVIVVPKGTPLKYHSVVKRVSDEEVYRLISTLQDYQTPAQATAQIARADCERWELT